MKVPTQGMQLHLLLGELRSSTDKRIVSEASVALAPPWCDHSVLGIVVFPASGYFEMAARAFAAATGTDWRPVVVRDIAFERPLVLEYDRPKAISITIDDLPDNGRGEATFAVASSDGNESYCRGRIAGAERKDEIRPIEENLPSCPSDLAIGLFYSELRQGGLNYGSAFANAKELRHGNSGSGEAIGRLKVADGHPFVHTVLLDGCLQVVAAAIRTLGAKYEAVFIPASVQSATFQRPLTSEVWSHVVARGNRDGSAILAQITIVDDDGNVMAELEGLELRRKDLLGAGAAKEPRTTAAGRPSEFATRGQLIAAMVGCSRQKQVAIVSRMLVNEVRDTIGQMADASELGAIDPTTAFLEIGMDSLMVTELQRRLQEKLRFRFRAMEGLDYQTIEALAEYLLDDVLAPDLAARAPSDGNAASAALDTAEAE